MPSGQRARGLQPLDLRFEQLVGHRQIADLLLKTADLGVPSVRRPGLQRHLARCQERLPPTTQLRGGHPELARQQFQILAPQKPQHRLLLASRRHPPPRLGRGPGSASVVGALRRAHAHPNVLVHPHLLAVAYLQSGVSANCRPGDLLRCVGYHILVSDIISKASSLISRQLLDRVRVGWMAFVQVLRIHRIGDQIGKHLFNLCPLWLVTDAFKNWPII